MRLARSFCWYAASLALIALGCGLFAGWVLGRAAAIGDRRLARQLRELDGHTVYVIGERKEP